MLSITKSGKMTLFKEPNAHGQCNTIYCVWVSFRVENPEQIRKGWDGQRIANGWQKDAKRIAEGQL